MMLSEFVGWAMERQVDVLYRKGVYVGKIRKDARICVLYQLDSFYVEVCYKKYRCSVEAIRCFENMGELDPYLEGIDIEPYVYL